MNNRKNDHEEVEIDLRELFFVVWRKIWIVVIAAVLGVVLAFAYTTLAMAPVYSSTSMLYVLTKSTSITSLTDLQVGTQLTQDYAVLITSRPVVDKVIDELDLDMSYSEFVKNLTVENPSTGRVLYITVKSDDAYMAKVIVDKLTDVSAARMAEIMETDEPNVVDYGHISENPSGPSKKKNCMLGGLSGIVLSVGIIVLLHLMNDRIRSTEDVEKYLEINTLGVIPLEKGVSKKKTHAGEKSHSARKK